MDVESADSSQAVPQQVRFTYAGEFDNGLHWGATSIAMRAKSSSPENVHRTIALVLHRSAKVTPGCVLRGAEGMYLMLLNEFAIWWARVS